MDHDDTREIFERLESLERLVRSRHSERGGRRGHRRRGRGHGGGDHHHHHDDCYDRDHGGDDFDEKRVIDTIVSLVAEHVDRIICDQTDRIIEALRSVERHEDGGGEKRIVDLIVACVSEHVQEIVATELDRRMVRTESKPANPSSEQS